MRVTRLHLEQFRSYEALELLLSSTESVHVLIGPNAAGKTNILEALGVLSLTKSCQGVDEEDMVRWGAQHYRVRASVLCDDGTESTLEVASQFAPRRRKACFRNDVQIPMGEMVGMLPAVFFLPQQLTLFTGSPQQRRQFLDQLLCQVSYAYLQKLTQYLRILKQRNSLLKNIARGGVAVSSLALWNEQLAEVGAYVTLKRLELIEMLQCTLGEELSSFGEAGESAVLVYERKGEERELPAMQRELLRRLEHSRERDVQLQATSVGPHREDWRLDIGGRSLPTFASRGQQRAAVVALLFLQVSYLELRRGEKPIVLLDDVFSELDDMHQEALLRSFDGYQVFVTATHVPPELHGAHVWEVGGGVVVQRQQHPEPAFTPVP
ncbi:MAG: DNA replication/repair protein RecF [Candidatus Peribacteraceae bacterium]|nr:DNA replication/repair protein RecF [Candidatus Peribacteraceae bacterium]